MRSRRCSLLLISAVCIIATGLAMAVGQASFVNLVQPVPTLAPIAAIEDGTKVTLRFHITPRDNPSMTYSNTEEFVQGQHIVPPGIEEQTAGMQPGEIKTFALSVEEGFGPHDDTKLQNIPTIDLPPAAKEGDTIVDEGGRIARIIQILPDTTMVDRNHPLAGHPLIVTLQIVTIENPIERTRNTLTGKSWI